MRIPSGVTDQYIYFVAVDSADYVSFETGLSSFTVRRSRNGGASAAYTTPTINETDVTNMPGVYELLLDEDMTLDSGDHEQEICLRITATGMAPVTRVFTIFRPDVTAGETITVSSGAVSTVTTATNVTTVNGLASGVITATSIAADAIGASELAADAVTEIANAVWDTDATGRQTQGTFGQAIGDPAADTNTIYKAVVTDATGATVGVDVVAVKAETAIIVVDTTTDIPALIDALPTAAENADAVWDEDATGHQTQGTFGQAIGDPAADANTIYKAVVTDAAGANVAADIIAVKAETAAIVADTNELQTDWVNGGRLDLIVDAILDDTDDIGVAGAGLTAINLPDQTMNITGDITGNLSGSVGSVTGAVGSVTGAVGSVTGAVGSVTGNVGGTINGLTAVALKDFFDTDSATTYASAVAGSVVKEIADNAGGASLTVQDIVDGVWDEDASGHQTQGTFGQTVGDSVADASSIHAYAAASYVHLDTVVVPTVNAIVADTAEIGAAGAGLTNINLPNQTMDIVGNITGNLSGSVGSVTGAVGSVTGAVGSVAAGGITASSFAANAITAAKLDPDVTTELQAGLATAANLATVAGYLDTEIAAILADTNELQTDWVDGGRLDLILDARASQTSVDDLPTNAELATSQAAADDATLAAIAALNNISAAQVNAEVVDALATDTYAEPGQGTPAATASLATKIGFLMKAWRNRTTQTASEYALYADDATTKDQEAVVSDDGVTFERGEVSTGA
jgi:uncharacterized membrane protein